MLKRIFKKVSDISWKGKKRIAEVSCAGIMVLTMVVSLCSPVPQETESVSQTARSGNRITSDGTGVSLQLDSTQVKKENKEDASDGTDCGNDTVQETAENEYAGDIETGQADEDLLPASVDGTDSDGVKRNRVVRNASANNSDGRNVVVKNPAPMTLVSTVFENHGSLPELGDIATKYQYPVELGYSMDRNYDGKQTVKDSILNVVMETTPENTSDLSKEEETTSKTVGEDTTEESASKADGEDESNTASKASEGVTTEYNASTTAEAGITEKNASTTEGETITGEVTSTAAGTEAASKEDGNETTEVAESKTIGEAEKSEWNTTADIAVNQDERNAFQKKIWSKILPTEPVEVKTKEALKVDNKESVDEQEPDTGNVAEENSAAEESETDGKQTGSETVSQTVTADAGYYIISGKMREGTSVFISDIEIRPSGVDGFDRVRIGKKGEFHKTVLLTEEGLDQSVELYFTDGERITKATTFTYSKDTTAPQIQAKEDDCQVLEDGTSRILCTGKQEVGAVISDEDSGIEQMVAVYGDRISYVTDSLEDARLRFSQDFYGRVLLSAKDKAGNVSEIVSPYYLVDSQAPEIVFSESEVCTAPYTVWVDLEENGHIVSGIDKVECKVDGETYDIGDLTLQENVKLSDTLEVPSKAGFSITFDEEGEHRIEVTVTDHAGNVTTKEQSIAVTQAELVAVYMPKEFTIHIDPQQLLGREKIFSDDLILENVSNVDVKVMVENVELDINDGISDSGTKKDCDLYLIAPDTGERIRLEKGDNPNVYSYCLPMNAKGDITTLRFVGETTDGSDAMWQNSDIRVNVKLRFDKWTD